MALLCFVSLIVLRLVKLFILSKYIHIFNNDAFYNSAELWAILVSGSVFPGIVIFHCMRHLMFMSDSWHLTVRFSNASRIRLFSAIIFCGHHNVDSISVFWLRTVNNWVLPIRAGRLEWLWLPCGKLAGVLALRRSISLSRWKNMPKCRPLTLRWQPSETAPLTSPHTYTDVKCIKMLYIRLYIRRH